MPVVSQAYSSVAKPLLCLALFAFTVITCADLLAISPSIHEHMLEPHVCTCLCTASPGHPVSLWEARGSLC